MTNWASLLGLPLVTALERVRAAGCEPVVRETCAPRRNPVEGAATQRVIRVTAGDNGPCLTVSAFMDGNPRKMES